jgi:hypothetical protein
MAVISQVLPLAAEYGTTGLKSWISENVVTVVLLALAVCILWAARGGNVGKGITIMAGMILGLVALGMASGNNANDIGAFLIGLFTKG